MAEKDDQEWGFATRAVRAGRRPTAEDEHSEPIFATSSFTCESAAEAAARFAGTSPGNLYSRFTNPTVRAFEERLAALEGCEHCVAFASRGIFGTTVLLFQNIFGRFGVDTTFVPLTDYAAWERAFRPNTKLLFIE